MATGLKDRRFGYADTHSVRDALENRALGLREVDARRGASNQVFHLHFALLFTFSSAR